MMSGDAIRKDAVLPAELAAAPPREHDFALVIGVEHYPSFSSLRGAVADAQAFHEWVCSPDGGAVPPANARLIPSTEQPVAPIQDQIDDELEAGEPEWPFCIRRISFLVDPDEPPHAARPSAAIPIQPGQSDAGTQGELVP